MVQGVLHSSRSWKCCGFCDGLDKVNKMMGMLADTNLRVVRSYGLTFLSLYMLIHKPCIAVVIYSY